MDARPYRVEEDERQQAPTRSRLSRLTDLSAYRVPLTTHALRTGRRAYRMKLISRARQVVDFFVPDDISIDACYLKTRLN
jgi:hypothetical protein